MREEEEERIRKQIENGYALKSDKEWLGREARKGRAGQGRAG